MGMFGRCAGILQELASLEGEELRVICQQLWESQQSCQLLESQLMQLHSSVYPAAEVISDLEPACTSHTSLLLPNRGTDISLSSHPVGLIYVKPKRARPCFCPVGNCYSCSSIICRTFIINGHRLSCDILFHLYSWLFKVLMLDCHHITCVWSIRT